MTGDPHPASIEEFEKLYAQRSGGGWTVEKLHEYGLHGETCDCGDEICEGFQMVGPERRFRR